MAHAHVTARIATVAGTKGTQNVTRLTLFESLSTPLSSDQRIKALRTLCFLSIRADSRVSIKGRLHIAMSGWTARFLAGIVRANSPYRQRWVCRMTEIAQLFESALRNNRASLLRKAAMNTVARMSPQTTLRTLLESEAGEAIRNLTLTEFREALVGAGLGPSASNADFLPDTDSDTSVGPRRRHIEPSRHTVSDDWQTSREEELYRRILDAMNEPITIGQLAKRVDLDVDELRGYVSWMKKMGKVTSSGRARATRYQAVR